MNSLYLWAKFLKKIRGSSILNSYVHPTSKIESGSLVVNSSFKKYSFCGYNCEVINCQIGSFTSIANNVIIGGGMHPMKWVGMSPVFYEGRDSVKEKFSTHVREPVKESIIEHDVWIGHSALIKQGIRIGSGAVVGMGSIVTKDIPPYAIVAGNPARIVRYRFEDDLVADLLESKWWDLEEVRLRELAVYIKNPREFIRRIKE